MMLLNKVHFEPNLKDVNVQDVNTKQVQQQVIILSIPICFSLLTREKNEKKMHIRILDDTLIIERFHPQSIEHTLKPEN